MIWKIVLITSIISILESMVIFVEAGNKEHVHIKLHVPEIHKKHTHVVTLYKHHYKPKPKPKHQKSKHHEHETDRLDPSASIHQGTLHSKYQSRPHWMEALRPTATKQKESSSLESHEPDQILNRWKQNMDLIQQQKSKKKVKKQKHQQPTIIDYSNESGEDESTNFEEYSAEPLVMVKPKIIHRPKMKASTNYFHKQRQSPKSTVPDYMLMDTPLSFSTGSIGGSSAGSVTPHSERLIGDIHTTQSLSHSHFNSPHLMKITQDDIRNKPMKKSKHHHHQQQQQSSIIAADTLLPASGWGGFSPADLSMIDGGDPHHLKEKYEWPAEKVAELEELQFTTSMPQQQQQSMMQYPVSIMDEHEFRPFKASAVVQQQSMYPITSSASADSSSSSDEYSTIFGRQPLQYQTYTKRKNKQNVMSNLNTRIMN